MAYPYNENGVLLGKHTLEDREAFIENHIKNYDGDTTKRSMYSRGRRQSGESRSPHLTLRNRARGKWNRKVKRELKAQLTATSNTGEQVKEYFGFCTTCNKSIDLRDNTWIDNDEMPIALDIQLKGVPTERKAINFVRGHHNISDSDYAGDDGKLHMYHHDDVRPLSHEEPGYEEHHMDMSPIGYWSFQ